MKLVFKNSQGKERTIANVDSKEQANVEINKFCSDKKYEVYYTRSWEINGVVYYDVGSWSEFFLLYLNE
jgi:hypothetical protein